MNKVLIFLMSLCALSINLFSVNEDLLKALCDKDYKTMKEILSTKPVNILDPISAQHDLFQYKYPTVRNHEMTIFHLAVLRKDEKALSLMLEAFPEYVDCQDWDDLCTPLVYLCGSSPDYRVPGMVDLLLRYGAEVNVVQRPLSLAVKGGMPSIVVELLLQKGADPTSVFADHWESLLKKGIEEGDGSNVIRIIELLHEYAPLSSFPLILHCKFFTDEQYFIEYFINHVNQYCVSRNLPDNEKCVMLEKIPKIVGRYIALVKDRYSSFEKFKFNKTIGVPEEARALIIDQLRLQDDPVEILKKDKKKVESLPHLLMRRELGGSLRREMTLGARK